LAGARLLRRYRRRWSGVLRQLPKIFERARTEMLRAMGFEQDELIANEGIIFVVRSVQVDYLCPARFNEQLQVSAKVSLAKKASLTFDQVITRGDDVLCTGSVRIACLDAHVMRPKAIPETLFRLILEHSTNEY
jgi:acyl-CoA thioester hydrolase, YbgC/YbaW family